MGRRERERELGRKEGRKEGRLERARDGERKERRGAKESENRKKRAAARFGITSCRVGFSVAPGRSYLESHHFSFLYSTSPRLIQFTVIQAGFDHGTHPMGIGVSSSPSLEELVEELFVCFFTPGHLAFFSRFARFGCQSFLNKNPCFIRENDNNGSGSGSGL